MGFTRRPLTMVASLGACLAVLVVAGCGSDDDSSTTANTSGTAAASSTTATAAAATSEGAAGKKVILASCASSNPNCSAFNKATKESIETSGAEVTVLENEFDPAAQVQQLNQAIADKPDMLVILPIDAKSVTAPIKKAKAAGVPVIVVSGRAEAAATPDVVSQIIPDNAALGKFAAQNVIDGLKEEGLDSGNVIAITGTRGAESTEARLEAFKKELATAPEYKLVAVEDGNWDAVKTGKIAQELFAKYASEGGIQAAYGMADYQAIPIVQAAKQAGMKVGVKNDGLIVTGSNCTKAGIEAVRAGDLYGSATQDPLTQGTDTASWIVKALQGEEIPAEVILPEDRITQDTVEQYAEPCYSS